MTLQRNHGLLHAYGRLVHHGPPIGIAGTEVP